MQRANPLPRLTYGGRCATMFSYPPHAAGFCTPMKFTKGLKDGLPVALGYLPVAFAYAIGAADKGFPFWFPVLISATNFTGTGQFAGTNLIAAGAGLGLLLATMLVINIRYSLMSVSLSQRTGSFPLWQRAIVAFGVTDENYAVAIRQPQALTFPYLTGLMGCSFAGWLGGTALGAALSEALSALLAGETGAAYYGMIMSAFNVSLYAMFVAIIVPPARGDKKVLLLVALSAGASCLLYFVPALHSLPAGVDIIVCSLACTAAVALLFPRPPQEDAQAAANTPAAAVHSEGAVSPAPGAAVHSKETAPDEGASLGEGTGGHMFMPAAEQTATETAAEGTADGETAAESPADKADGARTGGGGGR